VETTEGNILIFGEKTRLKEKLSGKRRINILWLMFVVYFRFYFLV